MHILTTINVSHIGFWHRKILLYCYTIAQQTTTQESFYTAIGLPKTINKNVQQQLQTMTGILAETICQRKSSIGAPLYYFKEKQLTKSCSISHHGNFGAFVFTLQNEA